MTNTPSTIHHIGLLHYHGALLSALHGLTEQFAIAHTLASRHEGHLPPTIRVTHWQPAEDGSMAITYNSHPTLPPTQPDIIIVPPSVQEDPLAGVAMQPISAWLTQRHAAGATLGSVCAGSFLLAGSGLLKGRTATTHWRYASTMARQYPTVRVEDDKLLIEDGDIITAGGMMSWTDLGLRIIHRLLGPTVMMETARFMLVDPPGREQRYYSTFSPHLTHGDAAILKTQHWLQTHATTLVTLPQMAAHAGLQPRTFLRRFTRATGLKPIAYLQHLRIGKARELLEFTTTGIEQIAWKVGYEDTGAFRKTFHRLTGLTPGDYRTRFAITNLA